MHWSTCLRITCHLKLKLKKREKAFHQNDSNFYSTISLLCIYISLSTLYLANFCYIVVSYILKWKKSVNWKSHVALWWKNLFNSFLQIYHDIISGSLARTRTRTHWIVFRCLSKSVQIQHNIISWNGAHSIRHSKWFKIGRWDSAQFRNPICSFHSGCDSFLFVSFCLFLCLFFVVVFVAAYLRLSVSVWK